MKISAGRLLGSRQLFGGEDVFIDLAFGDALGREIELSHGVAPTTLPERVGWFVAEQFYDQGFDGKLKLKLYRAGTVGGTLYEAKFARRGEHGLTAVSPEQPVEATV